MPGNQHPQHILDIPSQLNSDFILSRLHIDF